MTKQEPIFTDIVKIINTNDVDHLKDFFRLYREVDQKTVIKLLDKYSKIDQWDFNNIRLFSKKLNKKQLVQLLMFCDYFFRTYNDVYHLRDSIHNTILKW